MLIVDAKLIEVLGQPVPSRDELLFNCPFYHFDAAIGGHKPDTKRRLYVNLKKKKYTCYRCKAGGSVNKLYRRLGLSSPRVPSVSRYDTVVAEFRYGRPADVEKEMPAALPDDWTGALSPMMEGYRYLLDRGLDEDLIAERRIMLGLKALSGRVVFPSYDLHDKLDYWVARLYVPDPKGRRPKYKNPKKTGGAGRTYKLYWFDRIDGPDIFIAEGVLSALAIGRNATCTFGVNVTGDQIDKLARADFDRYYIAFDGEYDARQDAYELASKLRMVGNAVWIVNMPDGEDPASITKGELSRCIDRAWRFDSTNKLKHLAGYYG
jgi:DNA primase